MNGVRRFLAGGATPPNSTQTPSPQPTSPPPPPPLLPSGKPSWPPQSPSQASNSSFGSPKTNGTPGLNIRKDRQKLPLVASPKGEDDVGNTLQSGWSGSTSSPVLSPTRSQTSISASSPSRKPPPNGSATINSAVAGPSSPRILPPDPLTRKSSNTDWKRTSGLLNIRDELIMGLLASEAVVDSRECEILSAEEVEDLKKEHHILTIRLTAMQKKLNLETKIRDAALSLSRANSAHKKVSKQTEEQLEASERKVEIAQKELWRVSERAGDLQRKLLEHRAGVLSFSVRNMEKKLQPGNNVTDTDTSRMGTPSRSSQISSSLSTTTSVSTPSKARFDGAHLFAGHADALIPQLPKGPLSTADVAALEEKLRAATEALTAANKKQADMAREVAHLRLENQKIETTMGMELQNAEDTISNLEKELPRLENLNAQLEELLLERGIWEEDRARLVEREQDVERLESRLEVLEERSGEATQMEQLLADVKGQRSAEMQQKDNEILRLTMEWEVEKTAMEEERMHEFSRLQEEINELRNQNDAELQETRVELDEAVEALRTLIQSNGIDLFSRDISAKGLLSSVGIHLGKVSEKLNEHAKHQEEWDLIRRELEDASRTHQEKHEGLVGELEGLRRERDDARLQVQSLEEQVKQAEDLLLTAQVPTGPPIEYTGEAGELVAQLQAVWSILPAPDVRATRLGSQRHFRTASSNSNPGGSKPVLPSLSDMDVRSLKTLYDSRAKSNVPTGAGGNFTMDAFIARVRALVADDRALIERLIRFAQAHDLLKKNAERAQKLAQDSNSALETYQKQVTSLEDQNGALSLKQAALLEEIQRLHEAVDRAFAAKREVEVHAADQAETCRQLTEANNALSAKTLTLAEEAASAPEMVRRQLEAQLAECRASLKQTQDEIDRLHSSEQTQRIALLDELNSMQTENGNLRAQLRALKK
ncbi:hypothetical protein SERLA73DRAFT_48805 [Serpula lacrymans var. lacrymans S7.3]|uniref:Up-regulated during septation protein 1 domain-containing protein n=1 Tax=Serpula lacrymans var. lacrymans (strain S7.3) TaxID=936435 RepID=F8PPW1_SERL3|nr:hypothetical protein SERLA73DRAFT_48805 [Serpula lacrymans var. lacrymans S7.3]